MKGSTRTQIGLCDSAGCGFTQNTWHQIEIQVHGDLVHVYLNNTVILSEFGNQVENGKVGLYSSGNEGSHFQELEVKVPMLTCSSLCLKINFIKVYDSTPSKIIAEMPGSLQSMDENIFMVRDLELIREAVDNSLYLINAHDHFNCTAKVHFEENMAFNKTNRLQVIAGKIAVEEGCKFLGKNF